MNAKEYIESEYGTKHLKNVMQLDDKTSLLALMEEYAEWKRKNCHICDVSNSALLDIKEICESTDELPANFSNEQARNCDDALNQIMRIVDDIIP